MTEKKLIVTYTCLECGKTKQAPQNEPPMCECRNWLGLKILMKEVNEKYVDDIKRVVMEMNSD